MSVWQKILGAVSRRDNYVYHASTRLFRRKPKLVPKMVGLYAAYLFSRQPRLRILDIAVTTKCPYRCPHCYPEAFYRDGLKLLSPEDIASVAQQARALGAVQFNFQGGEPTLDLDRLESLVRRCRPWESYITISTNGYRHTHEDISRLYQMGVDKMSISLHSGLAEEHDAFVGYPGSYARVQEAIVNARKIGMEVALSVVVSRQNIRSPGIQQVFDLAVALRAILDVFVAMPTGRWLGQADNLLQDEDYRWLDEVNQRHPNIRRDLHPHLFRRGCPAAKEQLYINAYGDVLTCPFLHFSLGNIREHRLAGLREKALAQEAFRTYPEKCLACEDKNFFDRHITKTFDQTELPLDWEAVFPKSENGVGGRA